MFYNCLSVLEYIFSQFYARLPNHIFRFFLREEEIFPHVPLQCESTYLPLILACGAGAKQHSVQHWRFPSFSETASPVVNGLTVLPAGLFFYERSRFYGGMSSPGANCRLWADCRLLDAEIRGPAGRELMGNGDRGASGVEWPWIQFACGGERGLAGRNTALAQPVLWQQAHCWGGGEKERKEEKGNEERESEKGSFIHV